MYKSLAKTLFVGKNLIFLPSCHSTNQEVSDRLRETGMPDGSIIITANQTHGRGQRDNKWFSEPGKNLTFSILFHPKSLPAKDQFTLNMAISLGITDALVPLFQRVKIKWPNDIYADGRKLGGLLIQNTLKGHFIAHSIVGVGLNVNQQAFHLPRAVSLAMLTGRLHDLPTVFSEVCHAIEVRYMALMRGDDLKPDYLRRLYLYSEEHVFQSGEDKFTGIICDVCTSGELVVQTEHGMRDFRFKEIEFA